MNEAIATGLHLPDGPVALAGGCAALVEMGADRSFLTIIEVDGTTRRICEIEGRVTGLAVDGDGCFWMAGGAGSAVVRISPDGRVLSSVRGTRDGPFLLPNDLTFGPDGLLYVTDSGIRIADLIEGESVRADFIDAAYDGRIYQIDPVAGVVLRTLATGLLLAEGIAFDSQGLLYYSEMLTGNIYRQIVGGRQEVFSHVLQSPSAGKLAGPCGLAFDASGTLYCAIYGRGEICLVDAAGKIAGHIRTNGARPGNIAFTADGKYALITEQESGDLERIPVPRPGLALHRPSISVFQA